MHVLDASAVVELLAGRVDLRQLGADRLVAPHLIDSELLSALRRLERTQRISAATARQSLAGFGRLALTRHPVDWLLPRIWELRHKLTSYDATYVALTEALEATSLLTADERLAQATGVRCAIELI